MDFKNWRDARRTHKNFVEEEKLDYMGKVRKRKIFVTVEEDKPPMDPRDNVFNVDPKTQTSQEAVTAWMTKDSMVGLMKHSVHMSSGKAGKSKAKKAASGSMALGEDEVFDPFNPHDNLKVNGGPIPYSKFHKLKKKKVHEEKAGPMIEESMAAFADDKEEDELDFDQYGDGVERPKKVKNMSDKRKRAALTRGQQNPADQMRAELEYKANLENYKKVKGVETEDTVDHTKVTSYGAVDVRRKKAGEEETDDIRIVDEDALLAIQAQIDKEREDKMREVAEKELAQKEMQLVSRRVGDSDLMERNRGFIHKVASLAKRSVKSARGQFEEPTKVMPFLWLGNSNTAHNKQLMVKMGITHVLNTAIEVDNAFPELFVYSKIGLEDHEDQEMDGVFEHAFKFINRVRECGGRILVHCTAGVSRAASIVLGYIVQEEEQLLVDAYAILRLMRPIVDPNENFMYHLALLEMNTHEVTSVAFHKAWKFYKYTQLKSGSDEAWEGGPVARKQGVGLFVMSVFRKLGVPKKKSLTTRLLNFIFSSYHNAKQQQRQAAERAAKLKAKHSEKNEKSKKRGGGKKPGGK